MTGKYTRILVTGSRDWTDKVAVWSALHLMADQADDQLFTGMVVVHGACPTGADALASAWVAHRRKCWQDGKLDVVEEPHPAEWGKFGKGAGPIRNQEMVNLGAVVCLAFPLPASKGTKHCIDRCIAAGIPVSTAGRTSMRGDSKTVCTNGTGKFCPSDCIWPCYTPEQMAFIKATGEQPPDYEYKK